MYIYVCVYIYTHVCVCVRVSIGCSVFMSDFEETVRILLRDPLETSGF